MRDTMLFKFVECTQVLKLMKTVTAIDTTKIDDCTKNSILVDVELMHIENQLNLTNDNKQANNKIYGEKA